MQIERRFVFRGNATPVGGRISRPKELVIEAGGASSLTVSGGRSRGALKATRFGEFAAIKSAETLAEGLFDDPAKARALTSGRVREEALTSTTMVRSDVRGVVVGRKPALRADQLRAALVAASPGRSGEPSIRTRDLRIAGVEVSGHALVVDLDTELFEQYDTRSKLLTAIDQPSFIRRRAANFLLSDPGQALIPQADGMIYASVVREIRWKGRPYPGAAIDRHVVTIPDFGRIYFGEMFITNISRRLTMMRLQLGSPVGGFMAYSEVETNGSWYP